MSQLSVGDKAPAFTLPRDGGENVALKDYRGKWLVLYFYPKDSTPGCTKQAIAFSENQSRFRRAGAEILGVSKDSVKRHENFIAKQELKIPLASDESGEMLEKYGVWVLKKLYGREYMGIERRTFLIDPKGVIREIWPKVKVANHAEAVLDALKALK